MIEWVNNNKPCVFGFAQTLNSNYKLIIAQ